jgi:hypothetical protein
MKHVMVSLILIKQDVCKVVMTLDMHWVKTVPFKILFAKPKQMRPLGTATHRWEDNIKMNPEEMV